MSYNPLGITFQNEQTFPSQVFPLTGGNTLSAETMGFIINATITPADLLQLKFLLGLATSLSDTFIRADGTVTVTVNNGRVTPTGADAVQATSFIQDQTSPTISAFSLNLTTEILTVVADEPLDPAAFNGAGVTLQNSPNSTGINIISVTLTGGMARQSSMSIFQLNVLLSNFDLNQLKQMPELATHPTNVYMSLESSAFADFGGNGVNSISGMQALDADLFGGDLTPPRLSQFILDLNTGQIVLSFSEVVDFVVFDPSSIALQRSQGASEVLQFSSLTFIPSLSALNNLSNEIIYEFPESDLNSLKQDSALTFFALLNSDTTVDSNGHLLIGSSNQSAVPVSVISDISPPEIRYLIVDLDNGAIRLVLDEPVLLSSVDITALTLTCDRSSFFQIGEGSATQSNDTSFSVELSETELVDLLDYVLGRNCNLVYYTELLVSDIFDNQIAPVLLGSAIQANVLVPDMNSPQIISFELDMNLGILVVNFSEAINPQTFNPMGLTILNTPNGRYSYVFGSNSTSMSVGLRSIFVTLSTDDLSGIKAARDTATSRTNTYLTNSPMVIRDYFGNFAQELNSSVAIQATTFQEDLVNPEFVSFTFGAQNGRVSLSLTFTEVIDVTSINISQLIISSESNLTSPSSSQFMLLTSNPLDINGEVITIPLSDDGPMSDLSRLNMMSLDSFQLNSTYLYFPDGFAMDAQGLPVSGLSFDSSSQVTQEPGNLIPPELIQWNLDIDRRTMVLVFTEAVEVSSFDLTSVTLLSRQNAFSQNYSLTGGNVIQTNTTRYLVSLTAEDINGIQGIENLGVSLATTYIMLARGLARDFSGLDVLPITAANGLQAFNLTEDSRNPELLGFELSLSGNDPLILTFSETVLFRMFGIDFISLHGARQTSAPVFTFSSSTVILTTQNGPTIELLLTVMDKASLQQMPNLATTVENTFMTIRGGAVMDTNGNSVVNIPVESAIQASVVIPDTLPPFVSAFDIDMNQGILVTEG